MKKLMVLLVAAAASVCTQASTVSWAAANVYDGASKVAKGSNYFGLLCLYDASAGVSKTDLAAYLASDSYTTAEKIAKITSAGVSGSDVKVSTAVDGAFQLLPASAVEANPGTYTAYAIIFDVASLDKITDSTRYVFTSELASQTVPTSGNKAIAIGNQQSVTEGVAWKAMAVPEPTSGLLLLLGVAGLALRRRRA